MTSRFLVLTTVLATVCAGGMARAGESPRGDAATARPDAGSARGRTLVGKRVAVEVGAVVGLPSDAKEGPPPSVRDVAIDGTQLTEIRATGQETPLLVPSPRSHLEGDVEAADNDTLTVRLLGRSQVVTIPRAAIASLKIRQSRAHAGRGALIGAGVGLALGLGAARYNETHSYCGGEDRAFCDIVYPAAAIVGAAGGALLGAVAGAMTHTNRWERVDQRRLSVAVMPDPRGGVRGRLAVRF